MKTIIFIAILTLAMSQIVQNTFLTAKINVGLKAGAPSVHRFLDQSKLNFQLSKINQFIRSNVQEVKGLKLVSYRDQVVAGKKYFFIYDSQSKPRSKKVEITVYSRPWENDFLQVVRPNGAKIQKGGLKSESKQNAK